MVFRAAWRLCNRAASKRRAEEQRINGASPRALPVLLHPDLKELRRSINLGDVGQAGGHRQLGS